jgi:glucose-6-phosphate isomerase
MTNPASDSWERFTTLRAEIPSLGMSLDFSRMPLSTAVIDQWRPRLQQALDDMRALEQGAIANPDEQRMVGHYWLRNPALAPTPEIAREITEVVHDIEAFAGKIHAGEIRPATGGAFTGVLSIGIGGSALGPMFVADALADPRHDRLRVDFIDNTDPEGIERVLAGLSSRLGQTLVLVTSKSGGTPETRNGMLLVAEAYRRAGLEFAPHAVAITMPGSQLDKTAIAERWLARFPMLDWVGGRTSVLSAVGLLPAALQGLDIRGLLEGAAMCDHATREPDPARNPAALLALSWYVASDGRGSRDMVVLPYKDRLLLFSRYLQQLVMESLGKQLDLQGRRVEQGLAVYGNKGSTDQHAYVQQLRDGVPNFFAVFLRVLEAGGSGLPVEPGVTAGDFLHGFLLGTRSALSENGRHSLTITIPQVNARTVGGLIALFERAVGHYATLIGINAYHQPGVEAGKKAAAAVLKLQSQLLGALSATPHTAAQLAQAIGHPDVETVYLLLEHLVANRLARRDGGTSPATAAFVRA